MAPNTRLIGSSNGSSLVFDDETRRYMAEQIAEMVNGAMQGMNTRMAEMASQITALGLQNTQMGHGHAGVQMQHSRVAKIDFPKFSGDDVRGWLFRCEQLFLLDQVAEIDKVNLVSIHLYDKALLWHTQFMKLHNGFVEWGVYKQAVLARFGNVYDDPLSELKNLKYETSAREYEDAFDNLLSRVEISEIHALSLFMGGLPAEIAMGVRMFKPQTLALSRCLLFNKFTRGHFRSS